MKALKTKGIILMLLLLSAGELYAQNIDINLLKDINLNRNKDLDPAFRGLSKTAAPLAFGIPSVMVAAGLIRHDSATLHRSLYIGASLISAAAITNILKYTINRSRPYETYPVIEKAGDGHSPGFPSGHTSDAFALATSLTLTWPKWYIIAPSYLWALGVAYSRLDLGLHYPSDVLAGAIIGAGSASICFKAQQWLNRK